MSNETLTLEQYGKAVSDTGSRSPSIAIAAVGALIAHDAAQRAEIERLREDRERLVKALNDALSLSRVPDHAQDTEWYVEYERLATIAEEYDEPNMKEKSK